MPVTKSTIKVKLFSDKTNEEIKIDAALIRKEQSSVEEDLSVKGISQDTISEDKKQSKNVIDESNFLSRGNELCQLAQLQHSLQFLNMFRSIFGLEQDEITTGFDIPPNLRDSLFDYVCHEMHGCSYENITKQSVENYFVSIGTLNISFDAILSIIKKRNEGWLNDEVRDLFMDSVNLMNGFVNIDNLPFGTPIYALGAFMIMQLLKFSKCHPNPEVALDLKAPDFEDNLEWAVSNFGIRSSIANIMKASKSQANMG